MDVFHIILLSVGCVLLACFLILFVALSIELVRFTWHPKQRAMHTVTTIFTCCISYVIIAVSVMTIAQYVCSSVVWPSMLAEDTTVTAIRISDGLVNAAVIAAGLFHAVDVLLHIQHEDKNKLRRIIVPLCIVMTIIGVAIVTVFVALPVVIGGAIEMAFPNENSGNSSMTSPTQEAWIDTKADNYNVVDNGTNQTVVDHIVGTPVQLGAHIGDTASLILSFILVLVGVLLGIVALKLRFTGRKSQVVALPLLGMTAAYSIARFALVVVEAVFSQWLVDYLALDSDIWESVKAAIFLVGKGLILFLLAGYAVMMMPLINSKLVQKKK